MEKIAVLLTVFNRKEKTLEALANLNRQEIPDYYSLKVFMVDDGCTDGTANAVRSAFPKVEVISTDGNLYWNRGMHLAWQTASNEKKHDYYLWLNDDTMLIPGGLKTLLTANEKAESQAIIVGTTAATSDLSELTYGGRGINGQLIDPNQGMVECNFFNGNIVLIPRYVFDIVGMNDPVFHHALGDFDYGKRAAKKGIKSYVAPGVIGRCDAHETLPVWCNPKKSFVKRWRAFRSPLGNNPEEFFIYGRRHSGLPKALFRYFTNHLRVIWPQLWKFKETV